MPKSNRNITALLPLPLLPQAPQFSPYLTSLFPSSSLSSRYLVLVLVLVLVLALVPVSSDELPAMHPVE